MVSLIGFSTSFGWLSNSWAVPLTVGELMCKWSTDIDAWSTVGNSEGEGQFTTIGDINRLFDAIIDQFLTTVQYLWSNATVVHSPNFESSVLKAWQGNDRAINWSGCCVLKEMKQTVLDELHIEDERTPFAEGAVSREKTTSDGTIKLYWDLQSLNPTSKACERFIFLARLALSECRRGINSSNFEYQMLFPPQWLLRCRDINKIIVPWALQ